MPQYAEKRKSSEKVPVLPKGRLAPRLVAKKQN
jgi:hypothetical protein